MMDVYLTPASHAEAELTEKRSRFISRVWPVQDEEEAKVLIQETARQYHDARHTCWCYMLHESGTERYSDDGEPQGTAGQPMLEIFRRKGIENYCCTVTRYFGGILLGTGGLVRAYSGAAALALEAAGISEVRLWREIETEIAYSLIERARAAAEELGGFVEHTDYSASVLMTVLIPDEKADEFCTRIRDLSSGSAFCMSGGTRRLGAVRVPGKEA